MAGRYVAVIDAGTTGLRSMIFDRQGNVVAKAYKEYPVFTPAPGWAEQNPEDWWNAVVETMPKALREGSIKPEEIACVTVTNQQVTVTAIDKDWNTLYPAILWMDTRSGAQVERLQEELGDQYVASIVGMNITTSWNVTKILWLKDNRPDLFEKTYKFVLVDAYIYGKLTGRLISEDSNACFSAFDIRKRTWSEEILQATGIAREQLTETIGTGEVIGEVGREAAELTGLTPGTLVVSGCSDQPGAAIGLGVVAPGRFEANTGTGTFMIAHLEEPQIDPELRVVTNCSGVPGKWHFYGFHYLSGAILRWFRDEFGQAEKMAADQLAVDPYQIITMEAAQAKPGCDGLVFLPYFQGARTPWWDHNARGVFYGMTLGQGRKEMARAILESNGFGIRHSVDAFEQLGVEINEIRAAGGGARSALWRQIQADITGKPVLLPRVEEATALGAAILGWYGVGGFDSVQEACDELVDIVETCEPDIRNYRLYTELFEIYNEVYLNLKATFKKSAELRSI